MKISLRLLSRKPVPKTEDEIATLIEGFATYEPLFLIVS